MVVSQSAQVAMTTYHTGGLKQQTAIFSQFWKTKVHDQGAGNFGFLVKAFFLFYRWLSSCQVFIWPIVCAHMWRERQR